MAKSRKVSPIIETAGGKPVKGTRFVSHPTWMGEGTRRFEAAETNRLNEAHWQWAQDESINVWLAAQLASLRSRSSYESKQNGMILGMIGTYADLIVGADGPTLQIQSDNKEYNRAAEAVWRDWFYAPTIRPNVSGTTWLKSCIQALWKQGSFLDVMVSDPAATGPVSMRLRPINTRRLGVPNHQSGNPNLCMGVELDGFGRPARYWIQDQVGFGVSTLLSTYTPWPSDLVIHEFLAEEEDQAAGVPWLTPGLPAAADLRDYDDQVQDAARQIADQAALLYTDHPNAELWTNPEQTTVQRRTVRMAPPGWKPFVYPAAQPPVQYPDYRAERQRETGRARGMPLLLIRLDASKHNYSSARLDTQMFRIAGSGIQNWLSGTDRSYGTLNRLHVEILKEARFSIPVLRNPPPVVHRKWTWPTIPHVDPVKESTAEETGLRSRTITLGDALAARGKDLETHIEELKRERDLLEAAGLPIPAWMADAAAADTDPNAEGKQEADNAQA